MAVAKKEWRKFGDNLADEVIKGMRININQVPKLNKKDKKKGIDDPLPHRSDHIISLSDYSNGGELVNKPTKTCKYILITIFMTIILTRLFS